VKKTSLKIKLYGAIILGLMILPMVFSVEKVQASIPQAVEQLDRSVQSEQIMWPSTSSGVQYHADIMPILRTQGTGILELRVSATENTLISLDFHGLSVPYTRSYSNGIITFTINLEHLFASPWYHSGFVWNRIMFHGDGNFIFGSPNPNSYIDGFFRWYTNHWNPGPTSVMADAYFSYRIITPISPSIEITYPSNLYFSHSPLQFVTLRYSAPVEPNVIYSASVAVSYNENFTPGSVLYFEVFDWTAYNTGGENIVHLFNVMTPNVSPGTWFIRAKLWRTDNITMTSTLVDTSPVTTFAVAVPVTTPPPGWTPPAVTPIPTAPDIVAGLPTVLVPIVGLVDETVGGLNSLFNAFIGNITARFPFSWIVGIRDAINQEAQDAVDVIRYPTLNITLPAFGNVASSTVDMLPVTALMTSTHIMGQPNQFPTIVTIFRNILLFSSWILFSLFIIKRVRSFTNNLGTVEKN